jgi:hypothetical protein
MISMHLRAARLICLLLLLLAVQSSLRSVPSAAQGKLLIGMDIGQTDHLKAYGIAYWTLSKGQTIDWLLNYRGGSFMIDYSDALAAECRIRGVSFEQIGGTAAAQIYAEVQNEGNNMDVVRLEKQPRVAVYVPPGFKPWDDAVTLVMEYAEIPYTKLWDEEVLKDSLQNYDWLHVHHEDFTGQYGKFFANFSTAPWYIQQVALLESTAKKMGFRKVSELKKAVVEKIRTWIGGGGFMFAMCGATDTFDIAQAAKTVDICDVIFDGDPADQQANSKLDFTRTFAFENFSLVMNPYEYEFSTIDCDATYRNSNDPTSDYFTLFDFSAKYDPVPTMLTQDHVNVVRGFLGQTTAFHREVIKKSVVLMGEKEGTDEVKYLHGNFGRGTFTWFGGHDPEDYRHAVGDPATDLSLHRNSPGYRLILNNVLFPAAKKKKQKT